MSNSAMYNITMFHLFVNVSKLSLLCVRGVYSDLEGNRLYPWE